MRISVVVPMHNEQDTVSRMVDAVSAVFTSMPEHELELVLVDDGSVDSTHCTACRLLESDPRILVVELSRRFGKEAALSAGLAAATGDAVIPFDCDLQDPPELIPELVTRWIAGADVVLAKRCDRTSDSRLKRGFARAFYRLARTIFEVEMPVDVGDFRIMDRKVVDAVLALPEQQRMMKGLFAWVGFRSEVVEYTRQPRVAGTTKFSSLDLVRLALAGVSGFSIAPLRVAVYLGFTIAAAAMAYGIFIIGRTLIAGVDVPGYASLLVAVLFMGGLQMLFVGVVGEYVGRVFHESKRRPAYVVRSVRTSESAVESAAL